MNANTPFICVSFNILYTGKKKIKIFSDCCSTA